MEPQVTLRMISMMANTIWREMAVLGKHSIIRRQLCPVVKTLDILVFLLVLKV